MNAIYILLLMLISNSVIANPIVLGPTYTIIEEDALTWVETRAALWQTPEKEQELRQEFINTTKNYLARPVGATLPMTEHPREWLMDLTVEVEENIMLPDGSVLYPKGYKANPLAQFDSKKVLLFIDGDKLNHWGMARALAKLHPGMLKVVLTQGEYAENVKNYSDLAIYFDQKGILTRYFKIQAVPAIVLQQGEALLVREVLPGVVRSQANG